MQRRTLIAAALTTAAAAGIGALAMPGRLDDMIVEARLRACGGLDALRARSVADYQGGRTIVRDGWVVSASENELLDQIETYGLHEAVAAGCPASLQAAGRAARRGSENHADQLSITLAAHTRLSVPLRTM